MNTIPDKNTADPASKGFAPTLVVEHPFCCSTENFLDPKYSAEYGSLDEFLAGHGSLPDELNLCFRWDVEHNETGDGYRAYIFTVQQRKGVFVPVIIHNIKKDELNRLKAYLQRHWELLMAMWLPISSRS
jgi:hypothetical protein